MFSAMRSPSSVVENVFITLVLTINSILFILFCIAVQANSSTYLILPFTMEWFTLFLPVLHVIAKVSYEHEILARSHTPVPLFGTQTVLGLVSSIAITHRAWDGSSICDDFGGLPNPCRSALTVVGLSWLQTTVAFVALLLSCGCSLHRWSLGYGGVRKPYVVPRQSDIALMDLSARYPTSLYRGKSRDEEWTDIPL
ncbi:hypothetical protein R3P38DRAFT_1428059 [Favolaschia claudopus]|uniref:Uncharacterized protein n=1 Tax=Favolaschia claudopus TaxID=2862362 RepID=A0AAW0AP31_9AGAR